MTIIAKAPTPVKRNGALDYAGIFFGQKKNHGHYNTTRITWQEKPPSLEGAWSVHRISHREKVSLPQG